MTVVPFAEQSLSTPGCWAYPGILIMSLIYCENFPTHYLFVYFSIDMLEVGCDHGPGGEDDPGLSYVEARTHFSAWAIVSSPLILSHDTTNDAVTDEIWPIISNTEVIAVNAAWAGDSGSLFRQSEDRVILHTTSKARDATVVASWQQWSKKISDNSAAVLLMNNDEKMQTITLDFSTVPTFAQNDISSVYSVRDTYAHAEVGQLTDSYSVELKSHDSAFLILSKV